ncbi:hypothetical protein [Micromonospora sp. NPDC005203]|uniref:hypothetical protein n=1 Tax=Micromonospora sp. NPDC005203 TaxID=3364226 RepID=UPI0036C805CB
MPLTRRTFTQGARCAAATAGGAPSLPSAAVAAPTTASTDAHRGSSRTADRQHATVRTTP